VEDEDDWTKSGNDIYNANSGDVGIGTTSPSEKLHVYSGEILVETNPGQNSVQLLQGTIRTDNSLTSRYISAANGTDYWGIGKTHTGNNEFHIVNYPNSRWDFTVLASNGNVGIGTLTPTNRLSVSGNADFSGNMAIGASSPTTDRLYVSGNMHLAGKLRDASNTTGTLNQILSSSPGGVNWKDPQWIRSGSNIYSNVSGNVGIGTSTPAEKLEVVGNTKLGGTAQITGTVQISGGTPAVGKVLTSTDASGNTSWMHTPGSRISFGEALAIQTFTADGGANYHTIATTTAVLTQSTPVKLEANLMLRLTTGDGSDYFNIAVKIVYGATTTYSDIIGYEPNENSNNHDNYSIVSYLDYHQINYTGTVTFSLVVKNHGDDQWQAANSKLFVTQY
jgi:hypothetical protein